MRFDTYTITLLILRPDAPELDDVAADELQSRHLAHLADMHDRGLLLAAGPLDLFGPPDHQFRGLSIWNASVEEVERIVSEHPDPSVVAGRFSVRVIPWMVPAGALSFAHTFFPRSVSDARSD
ncbi:MAG: hypothetical protein JOY80_08155 [Candidatus Dormibacteraeota bacterium]|nr:hypothetical protein [Candidatus Dormibacteraeota bacterium]